MPLHPVDTLTNEEWDLLPLHDIPIYYLRFSYHNISGDRIDALLSDGIATWPPIRVARDEDGSWVQDGRHRVIAARHLDKTYLPARVHTSFHPTHSTTPQKAGQVVGSTCQ